MRRTLRRLSIFTFYIGRAAFYSGRVADFGAVGHADGFTLAIGEVYIPAFVCKPINLTAIVLKKVLNFVGFVVAGCLFGNRLLSVAACDNYQGKSCQKSAFHGWVALGEFCLKNTLANSASVFNERLINITLIGQRIVKWKAVWQKRSTCPFPLCFWWRFFPGIPIQTRPLLRPGPHRSH